MPTPDQFATPPDQTPAPAAAEWLADPQAPPTETAAARLIRKWETEPEWTPENEQL